MSDIKKPTHKLPGLDYAETKKLESRIDEVIAQVSARGGSPQALEALQAARLLATKKAKQKLV